MCLKSGTCNTNLEGNMRFIRNLKRDIAAETRRGVALEREITARVSRNQFFLPSGAEPAPITGNVSPNFLNATEERRIQR